MEIRCSAIFESGVLTPKQPIDLPEGTEVEIVVVRKEPPSRPGAGATPFELLSRIAALPSEGTGDPRTSEKHDQYLYGQSQ